jgi:arylsulfatase A-like enzyme
MGFYEQKDAQLSKENITNPMVELLSSTFLSETSPKLFSMNISDNVESMIADYHQSSIPNRFDTAGIINNIVLFVLESTPRDMVSIFNPDITVTPNLQKWKSISTKYPNVYAHYPATVYSMGCLISGVYPLISYKSLVTTYPNNTIPSISGELRKNDWQTSLLVSADLSYSNMRTYAGSQKFTVAKDVTNIVCKTKFGNSNSSMDRLDDKCLVDAYFDWFDTTNGKKKFSMLWTNQTHYPYYVNQKEEQYVNDNADKNRY